MKSKTRWSEWKNLFCGKVSETSLEEYSLFGRFTYVSSNLIITKPCQVVIFSIVKLEFEIRALDSEVCASVTITWSQVIDTFHTASGFKVFQ